MLTPLTLVRLACAVQGASRANPTQDALEAGYDSGGDPDKSYLTWSLRPFLQHLQVREKLRLWVIMSVLG